jgi:DeoR/GlpR family transcriptional regulator of sugar metabolism
LTTIKLISERHQKIYELLLSHNTLSINKISSLLGISKMTVRRDLDHLSNKGTVQRVHGGAIITRTKDYEPPYMIRSLEMKREKEMIGQLAASLIKENEVIIVDVGSTLLELVKNIPEGKNITVITNWIPAAVELSKKREGLFNIVLLGGKVYTDELSIMGNYSEEMLKNFNADVCFLGVGGISGKLGLTDYNMDGVQIKKQMIKSSKKVVVLSDHTKFDRVAHIRIADLKSVDQIITDDGIEEANKSKIERFGTKVIVAKESMIFQDN